MGYTIKQVAEKIDLTAYTLRYYEKEGLLPLVGRNEQGNRVFEDKDIEWIQLISCLRDTGMSVAEIRRYVELCKGGSKTIEVRRRIIQEHKEELEQKIAQMQTYLVKITNKLQRYDELAVKEGVDVCNPFYTIQTGHKNK